MLILVLFGVVGGLDDVGLGSPLSVQGCTIVQSKVKVVSQVWPIRQCSKGIALFV